MKTKTNTKCQCCGCVIEHGVYCGNCSCFRRSFKRTRRAVRDFIAAFNAENNAKKSS